MKILATHPQVGEVEVVAFDISKDYVMYEYGSGIINHGMTKIENLTDWRVIDG